MSENFLVFVIDGEHYAAAQKHLLEIIGHINLHEVQAGVNYTKGIINLRGEAISVIDVRKQRAIEETDLILILRDNPYPTRKLGICVDVVEELKPLNNLMDFHDPRGRFSHVLAMSCENSKRVTILDTEAMLHQEV